MSISIPQQSQRDLRLDFFRGLALITIFINHVPGNAFEHLTSRNFGFSDAAEAFVLMSGIAAGLAYTSAFLRSRADAAFAIFKRSAKLYSVHIGTTVLALLFLLWSQDYLGTSALSERLNLGAFLNDPDNTTLGLVTLGHQLGYFNILPLYIVLLAVCPFMLQAAVSNRRLLICLSLAVWATAGTFGINLPSYPTDGGWFLNPFCWQLVFVIGLCIGVGVKKGKPLVGYSPFIMTLAVAYAFFSAYVIQFQRFDLVSFEGLPAFLAGFDKGILPLPRLTHILALAYIVAYLPITSTVSNAKVARPIVALGRESLAVFAWGSVIALVLQAYKETYVISFILDSVALATGILVQYGVAIYCRASRTGQVAGVHKKVQPAG